MSVEVKKVGDKAEVTITSDGKKVSFVAASPQELWRMTDSLLQQMTPLFGHRRVTP